MNLNNKRLPITKYKLQTRQGGFTLIETLIYIAITGVILVSFVFFSLSISDSRDKSYVVQEVQANSRLALNLIAQKIRRADDVITPTEGNSNNSLTLDMPVPDPDMTFSIIGGVINITEGAVDTPITSNKINVSNLTFTNLAGIGERDNIRVELVMEYKATGDVEFTYSESIDTAVSLRK